MTQVEENVRRVVHLLPAKPAALTGSAEVLRALPRREQRRVGSFVFFDHFGPHETTSGAMDVPPHPHVGLQTVTYLFSGAIEHRDSLGSVQVISPGDVNWMTAGRAITHAETVVRNGEALHGIQTWVGLPRERRKMDPAFEHFAAAVLPRVEYPGAVVRVIAGTLGERRSPVSTHLPLTYLDLTLQAGAELALPVSADHELALYVAIGEVTLGGTAVPAGVLATLGTGGVSIRIGSTQGARALLFGGVPLPEPTAIWWNFIVDSVEEGRACEADWKAGKFPRVPGFA
ncbi:pirin family protein [Nevskia soli]|uniref:pirin family protein n=1 Tax=Nevskia soli TaxID=418856 RepID=UPI000A077658|nr:pirin family protein [Nevskia soli]